MSTDGRGQALDNVFIERLWWSVKYEEIYPSDFADGIMARRGLTGYFGMYNTERRHQSLGKKNTRRDVLFSELRSAPIRGQERSEIWTVEAAWNLSLNHPAICPANGGSSRRRNRPLGRTRNSLARPTVHSDSTARADGSRHRCCS